MSTLCRAIRGLLLLERLPLRKQVVVCAHHTIYLLVRTVDQKVQRRFRIILVTHDNAAGHSEEGNGITQLAFVSARRVTTEHVPLLAEHYSCGLVSNAALGDGLTLCRRHPDVYFVSALFLWSCPLAAAIVSFCDAMWLSAWIAIRVFVIFVLRPNISSVAAN